MRIQHGIIPPAPGRGGNRKRKREEPEPVTFVQQGPDKDGYGSFKVEPAPEYLDERDRLSPALDHELQLLNGGRNQFSLTPDVDDDDDDDDGIPKYLASMVDPQTGLIMGRSPAMIRYLVMKAKHDHALSEHASLLEELRTVRQEELVWRERKDQLLDEVLRRTFG